MWDDRGFARAEASYLDPPEYPDNNVASFHIEADVPDTPEIRKILEDLGGWIEEEYTNDDDERYVIFKFENSGRISERRNDIWNEYSEILKTLEKLDAFLNEDKYDEDYDEDEEGGWDDEGREYD